MKRPQPRSLSNTWKNQTILFLWSYHFSRTGGGIWDIHSHKLACSCLCFLFSAWRVRIPGARETACHLHLQAGSLIFSAELHIVICCFQRFPQFTFVLFTCFSEPTPSVRSIRWHMCIYTRLWPPVVPSLRRWDWGGWQEGPNTFWGTTGYANNIFLYSGVNVQALWLLDTRSVGHRNTRPLLVLVSSALQQPPSLASGSVSTQQASLISLFLMKLDFGGGCWWRDVETLKRTQSLKKVHVKVKSRPIGPYLTFSAAERLCFLFVLLLLQL